MANTSSHTTASPRRSYQTEIPDSPPLPCRNSAKIWTSDKTSAPHTTHRPMANPKEPTNGWNNTFRYLEMEHKQIGLSGYHWHNTPTMPGQVQQRASPHLN